MQTLIMSVAVSFSLLVAAPALACEKPTKRDRARLKKKLLRAYQMPVNRKVSVHFPKCLAPAPIRIAIETGAGHGGYLRLDELQLPSKTGDPVVAQSLVWPGHYGGEPPLKAETKTIQWRAIQRAVRDARILMGTRITELQAKGLGGSGWGDTASFSAGVRLEAADGTIQERYYVGYPGGGEQPNYRPIVVARDGLAKALDKGTLKSPLASASPLFHRRFRRPDYRVEYGWWVHERLLKAAATFAGTSLYPLLIKDANRPVDGVHRIQRAALDALAKRTGTVHLKLPSDTKSWSLAQFQAAYRSAAKAYAQSAGKQAP